MKFCVNCNIEKSLDDFYVDNARPYVGASVRIHSWCKECVKAAARVCYKRRHESGQERERGWRRKGIVGVTWNDFVEMYADQDGRCLICDNSIRIKGVGKKKTDIAHLDHDHSTGRARGILCQNCNVALGLLRDDPDLFRAAAEYLEEK